MKAGKANQRQKRGKGSLEQSRGNFLAKTRFNGALCLRVKRKRET